MHCVSLTLDQKVLLGGEDSLLGLVMGQLAGAQVGGGATLGEQHGGLGGGVSVESGPGKNNIAFSTQIMAILTWKDPGQRPQRRREQRSRGDQRWGRGCL